MRISDCSSDVCSSDLNRLRDRVTYQAQHVGGRRLRNVGAEQIRTLYRYRRGHGAAVGTADDAELRLAGDAACNQIFGNRIYIVERILLELQDRTSTRLNSSHECASRMPSSA